MARTHAAINLDIWSDEDWRGVTQTAQWLYLALLSSPSLSFAGVADWRPARLAALSSGLDADDIRLATAELTAREFVLVDPCTEEVLIRSFARWDGLLKSPNIVKALVRDHGTTASLVLRAVLVDQLHRIKRKPPPPINGKPSVSPEAWNVCAALLKQSRMTFAEGLHELYGEGSDQRSGEGSEERSAIRRLLLSPFSVLQAPDTTTSKTKSKSSSYVPPQPEPIGIGD